MLDEKIYLWTAAYEVDTLPTMLPCMVNIKLQIVKTLIRLLLDQTAPLGAV